MLWHLRQQLAFTDSCEQSSDCLHLALRDFISLRKVDSDCDLVVLHVRCFRVILSGSYIALSVKDFSNAIESSTADDDANGCISRAELKNAVHDMKREHRMAHDAEIDD